MKRIVLSTLAFTFVLCCAQPARSQTAADITSQVRAAETAFAKTMADRDFAAFTAHLSDETVFFNGQTPIRGKAAVAAAWKAFFDGEKAPFAWAPETVEVLDSGTLALTSGPVRDPAGRQTGTFSSIWRKDADGRWRIVFDKGCPPCAR